MSAPLVSLEGLTIAVRAGRALRPVVKDLSLAVAAGETLGLIGESGSGKTMAARAIPRLLPRGVQVTAGGILFRGDDMLALSQSAVRAHRGRRIGLIFQEPMTALNPALTVGLQLMEAARRHGVHGAQLRQRALEMLDRLEVSDARRRLGQYPHELSGGLRQRVMIAAALLPGPDLIIADEPTTALDAISQTRVMGLLAELAREANAAMLLISHDLGVVAEAANKIVVMKDGEVVESGATAACLSCPSHAYTLKLLEALPRVDTAAPPPVQASAPLIAVKDAGISFAGRRPLPWRPRSQIVAVDGVSLEIAKGECVAVVGESGSGKSTLGRAALGLQPLAAGAVSFDGRQVAADNVGALRKRAQLIFQDPYSSLNPRMQVKDIIAAGPAMRGMPKAERDALAARWLGEVGLDESFGARLPHQLSGGQRQRVGIARALAVEPDLVVADEPLSALDLSVQAQILALIRRLQQSRGFALMLITHNLPVVMQIAHRVVVMRAGKIVETGAPGELFADARHPYTHALLAASPYLARDAETGAYALRRLAAPATGSTST